MRSLTITQESWPIRGTFTISRGAKTSAEVLLVSIGQDGSTGRGECVPYARYGESMEGVVAQIEAHRSLIEGGIEPEELRRKMAPGAARNAVDCALWDLRAKCENKRVWDLLDIKAPKPVDTAYTLSMDTPDRMAEQAAGVSQYPTLKLKLGGPEDLDRLRAVHEAAPQAQLIIDANEAWQLRDLLQLTPQLADNGVVLLEQPVAAGRDAVLDQLDSPVPICADESCHTLASLDILGGRYKYINIKLDKAGGLTEAVELARAAQQRNIGIMVGCMVGTSLAMAPAMLLAGMAEFVDLDGPLLLAQDRVPALAYDGVTISPPEPALWG